VRTLADEMGDARKKSKKAVGNSKGLADIKAGKETSSMSKLKGIKGEIGKSQGLKDIKNSKPRPDISKRTKDWLK
jgi:hypothetical protein